MNHFPWFLARALELVTFTAFVWALFNLGIFAGFMSALFFVYVFHTLKPVRWSR